MIKSGQDSNLRSGFTTGACAALTIKAAWQVLTGKLSAESHPRTVSLLFPDCEFRNLDVYNCELRMGSAYASTVKDAGDDPDITDKAVITAEVRAATEFEATDRDYILRSGNGTLILRGGKGIGIAEKPGVDVPVGKWAINPIPREMIYQNLLDVGFGLDQGVWLAEISIKNGEQLALKTLNPTLGISGGLSILGTTGIVEPKSHAAYIKTIEILLKGLKREKIEEVFLCTGASTVRAGRHDFPDSPEYAFIRIGDFIADSLELAVSMDFQKIIVCCMPGKLFKYASGHRYTHAHDVKLDLQRMRPLLKSYSLSETVIEKAVESVTFRGVLDLFDDKIRKKILNDIGIAALGYLQEWSGKADICELRCYNYHKKLQGNWNSLNGNQT